MQNKVCNLNAMVLGQTGVGKSSLINYIFNLEGNECLAARAGAPVTEKGNFAEREIDRNQLHIKIYDSWGLEDGKGDEWKKIILGKIESLKSSFDSQIHAIIYCIGYSKPRVQDFDVNFIKDLLNENNHVIIALTQCDLRDDAKKNDFKEKFHHELKDFTNLYDVVEICSISGEPKIGQTKCTEKSGEKEMFDAISAEYLPYLVINKMGLFPKECKKSISEIYHLGPEFWKGLLKPNVAMPLLFTVAKPIFDIFRKNTDISEKQSDIYELFLNQKDNAREKELSSVINKSLCQIISDINSSIVSFQDGVGLCCHVNEYHAFHFPKGRDVGVWDKLKETFMDEPVKNLEQMKYQSILFWVQKIQIETTIHYLNLLGTERCKLLISQYRDSYFETIVLYSALNNMSDKITRDLYIKGICDENVFLTRKKNFAKIFGINPEDILVLYDKTIWQENEGCAFTKDAFYCGDEEKPRFSDYGDNKIEVILRYLKQFNGFGDWNDAIIATLENVKGYTSWFFKNSNIFFSDKIGE